MIQCWYHANCNDGLAAAAVCYKKFGDSAKYIPVKYGEPRPSFEAGDVIYIVDFSYSYKELYNIAESGCNLVVLDHHQTAQAELEGREWMLGVYVHFDQSKSGAMLAWEYFYDPIPVPLLIQLVQDRDLWQFKYGDTKAFSAGIALWGQGINDWYRLLENDSLVKSCVKEGETVLKYQEQLIKQAVSGAWMESIAGYAVPVVNTTVLGSEIGEALLYKYPESNFSASFRESKGKRTYSLRSGRPGTKSEDFDCSVIAKSFGGGGHKFASGFVKEI